jgi:hypothetical protein
LIATLLKNPTNPVEVVAYCDRYGSLAAVRKTSPNGAQRATEVLARFRDTIRLLLDTGDTESARAFFADTAESYPDIMARIDRYDATFRKDDDGESAG